MIGDNKLDAHEALEALNTLRSEVVATQNAGWSTTIYPLVAILNAAGYEQYHPTDQQIKEYLSCHGGAGGYPGHVLREPQDDNYPPIGKLGQLERLVRRFLDDPTDEVRNQLETVLAEKV